MSSWSKHRRFEYAGIVIAICVAAVVILVFYFFYTPPSCFDGVRNGREQGLDCGGSCARLCPSSFMTPTVSWTRFEEVAPGLYNLGAYIINPNPTGEAVSVPYRFTLYDGQGLPVTVREGSMVLPPQRAALAFAGAVDVGRRIPAKALFEFTASLDWHSRPDPLVELTIGGKEYFEDETGSSLTVEIGNTGLYPLGRMSVSVILYDSSKNALGFSRTVIDGIQAQSQSIAPFTWPVNRHGKVVSIEVLPVAE